MLLLSSYDMYVYAPVIFASLRIMLTHTSCMPRFPYLTSYDLSCRSYLFDMHVIFYSCLPCLAQSNGVTLGVTGEDHSGAIAQDIMEVGDETPQQLVEWAPRGYLRHICVECTCVTISHDHGTDFKT